MSTEGIKLFITSLNTAYERGVKRRWSLWVARPAWGVFLTGLGLLSLFVIFLALIQFFHA